MLQENEHLGIFHFHSEYSFDSYTKITTIADKIEALNLEFAVLTDHDDVRGSLALAAEIEARALQAEIPPAAEYKTEIGDIIIVGLSEDLKNLSSEKLVATAKKYGAISILPHPYDGHELSEELLNQIDVVEVFNGRSSSEHNNKSMALAESYDKPMIFASDAHLARHLGYVLIAKPRQLSFSEAAVKNKIRCITHQPLGSSDLFLSQLIKARKQQDYELMSRTLLAPILSTIRVKFPHLYQFLKTLKK